MTKGYKYIDSNINHRNHLFERDNNCLEFHICGIPRKAKQAFLVHTYNFYEPWYVDIKRKLLEKVMLESFDNCFDVKKIFG